MIPTATQAPAQAGTYETIKALAKRLNRPALTLIALTHGNDPYYADTPGRREAAEWFAELWHRLGFGPGTHLRKIHYVLISQTTPIMLPIGNQRMGRPARPTPYVNTLQCWEKLGTASKDARYLGLVPISHIIDRRNDEPVEHVRNCAEAASVSVDEPELLCTDFDAPQIPQSIPQPPDFDFSPPIVDQKFHVELWAEKTTQNDILLPLASRYGLNVVTASGEISLTACWNLVQRALRIQRPVRILYVSDFDPAGICMPLACARKIQFLAEGNGLDIQVRSVVLTEEQCRDYRLPRTPLKETEHRAAHFEARFGEGATELDALEAIHPGALHRILVREIERYYDDTLDDRVKKAAEEFSDHLENIREEVIERHRPELDAATAAYRDVIDECNAAISQATSQFSMPIKAAVERFNAMQEAIADELEANALDDIEEVVEPVEGEEDDDPLYDSARDYVEQTDRFKRHQGKSTTRVTLAPVAPVTPAAAPPAPEPPPAASPYVWRSEFRIPRNNGGADAA